MGIEKPSKKKGAFVPEEKQGQFAKATSIGKQNEEMAQKLESDAEWDRVGYRAKAAAATGLGITAAAGALTGNPVIAGAGLAGAAAFGIKAYGTKKSIEKMTAQARSAKKKSEEAFSASRKIVEEGMKAGGATEEGGELRATDEQVEAARKEKEESK